MRQFRPSATACPANAHRFVKFIYGRMAVERVGLADLAERSGVIREAISAWRTRNSPSLLNLEAVLGALGYELKIVPKRDQ